MLLRRLRSAAVAAATMAVAACAMGPDLQMPGERIASDAVETTVVVENGRWADARVSVIRDGTNVRSQLGMVTSMQTRRFEIPRSILANGSAIRLAIDPVGSSDTFVTERIPVSAGDVVDLRLNEHLATSNWTIR